MEANQKEKNFLSGKASFKNIRLCHLAEGQKEGSGRGIGRKKEKEMEREEEGRGSKKEGVCVPAGKQACVNNNPYITVQYCIK